MIWGYPHDYNGNLPCFQYIAYETSQKGDLLQQELLGCPAFLSHGGTSKLIQIIHFVGMFHYKQSMLGIPHLWKPLYTIYIYMHIIHMMYMQICIMHIPKPTHLRTHSAAMTLMFPFDFLGAVICHDWGIH